MLWTAGCVSALQLGEINVRSKLGFPFSATIPVYLKDDEQIDSNCIHLDSEGGEDASHLRQASLRVEKSKSVTNIFLATRKPINEPLLRLSLTINCSGVGTVTRDFPILLDPTEMQQPVAVSIPSAGTVNLPSSGKAPVKKIPSNVWVVANGETLQRIAKSRYPGDRRLQRLMQDRVLKQNPDIASAAEPLEEGRKLTLPSTRALKRTLAAMNRAAAAQNAPVQKPAPVPAQAPVAEKAPQAANEKGRLSVSVENHAGGADVPTDAGKAPLKLSYQLVPSVKDLSPEERDKLRQKLNIINSDDQLAYLVEMQTQIQQMRQEMAKLKAEQVQQQQKAAADLIAAKSQAVQAEAKAKAAADVSVMSLPGSWWLALSGLIVGGTGMWFYRRKKPAQNWTFDEELMAAASLPEANVRPTVAPAAAVGAPVTVAAAAAVATKPAATASEAPLAPAGGDASIVVDDAERWAVEEAQVFLSHGWNEHAISLLREEIDKNPYHLDLWLMLFEIYKKQKMAAPFAALAERFKEIAFGLPIWDKVSEMQAEMDAVSSKTATAPVKEAPPVQAAAVPAAAEPVEEVAVPVVPEEPAAVAEAAETDKAPTPENNTLEFESVWLKDEPGIESPSAGFEGRGKPAENNAAARIELDLEAKLPTAAVPTKVDEIDFSQAEAIDLDALPPLPEDEKPKKS
ncbi:type IV pilus assembly protein FimV [Leeia oryzae]|uniref:type IV pilus assembly protein FimV n=1 Tax=Leeia oryzae TaxID=356662 RepID=UPI0005256A4E|nr:hypothetical protein [Leeia oryzae]